MDRPYSISAFGFPSRWDRDSVPRVVERASRSSGRERIQDQADCDKQPDSVPAALSS